MYEGLLDEPWIFSPVILSRCPEEYMTNKSTKNCVYTSVEIVGISILQIHIRIVLPLKEEPSSPYESVVGKTERP
jgi:hypothetical protein